MEFLRRFKKLVLPTVILLGLYACKDKQLAQYYRLVDTADSIVMKNHNLDSSVITASPILNNVKDILKRNIQPQSPVKFLSERSIVLYSQHKKIGTLLISKGNKPVVNFRSDSLNMTFPLTYGIGMTLDNITSQQTHR